MQDSQDSIVDARRHVRSKMLLFQVRRRTRCCSVSSPVLVDRDTPALTFDALHEDLI